MMRQRTIKTRPCKKDCELNRCGLDDFVFCSPLQLVVQFRVSVLLRKTVLRKDSRYGKAVRYFFQSSFSSRQSSKHETNCWTHSFSGMRDILDRRENDLA